jgi:hypothetical protein
MSFLDCLELHKLTVFSADAAEKQHIYIQQAVHKPQRATVQQHILQMGVLNDYIRRLPTLKDSSKAVPMMRKGNIPFGKALSQKSRKGWIPKKSSSKSKKLELNCTNLMLNSKNTRSDHAVVPDPGVSSGLYVKSKTIRVLLDPGSSGDLLFMKKGSSKCISVMKRVVPQSWWGTSNGTFRHRQGGRH